MCACVGWRVDELEKRHMYSVLSWVLCCGRTWCLMCFRNWNMNENLKTLTGLVEFDFDYSRKEVAREYPLSENNLLFNSIG